MGDFSCGALRTSGIIIQRYGVTFRLKKVITTDLGKLGDMRQLRADYSITVPIKLGREHVSKSLDHLGPCRQCLGKHNIGANTYQASHIRQVILLLEMILSDGECDDEKTKTTLITDCLALLNKANKSSSMSLRGIKLIQLLLNHVKKIRQTPNNANIFTQTSNPAIIHTLSGLQKVGGIDIRAIAAQLMCGSSTVVPTQEGDIGDLDIDVDLGDLDIWVQNLDLPLSC
jgi:hypothetical protein